jgi:hypothetical protein
MSWDDRAQAVESAALEPESSRVCCKLDDGRRVALEVILEFMRAGLVSQSVGHQTDRGCPRYNPVWQSYTHNTAVEVRS